MKPFHIRTFLFILVFPLIQFIFTACTSEYLSYEAPMVSPKESLKLMEIEDGFKIELVANEPTVNTPVAMLFDDKGRIWVVEMQGYMLDTVGTGEDLPSGKIVILEDRNKDGFFESRKVFIDSLVLPRAISFIEDGILIAEPPFLWYVEIVNDLPGKKILVDEKYAEGGNVEHQPNGLLRGLDNWIYNAKSSKRYRKKGEDWIVEKTHFRGQWGIAQDDHGRLYYNHNSANVLGDYFSPSFGATNINQRKVAGYNETIVTDNRVYPARATTGVNRGYMEGFLDDSLRLVNFTAAGGLTIYRGELFGKEFSFNAFVTEPAANLIKRNILTEEGNTITGRQAYQTTEFIRSTDERFRPVNLYTGPDGALYIVDMYRGIIQHKTFLTDYLKGEIEARGLEQPHSFGRIYRVVPKKGKAKMPTIPNDPQKLIKLLDHKNGWVRDKAQQTLIDKKMLSVVPELRDFLKESDNSMLAIHSLWTLEGLEVLKMEDVLPLLNHTDWHVQVQALSAIPSVIDQNNYKEFTVSLKGLINKKDSLTAPYAAFIAHNIRQYDGEAANGILDSLIKIYPKNKFVADAIISNLQDKEDSFLASIKSNNTNINTSIIEHLETVILDIKKSKDDVNTARAQEKYPKGAAIFKANCMACHGRDGYGIEALAPPLNNSNWVNGDKRKLIATVLYGLSGSILVNGEPMSFASEMPGIGQNSQFSNKDIAQTLSFVRSAWSNNASEISEEEVEKIREKFKDREKAFTMPELNSYWD